MSVPGFQFVSVLKANESGELAVQLVLEGRVDPILLRERLRHPPMVLTRPPAALFLDVGSAFSKFMAVNLDVQPTVTALSAKVLATRPRKALTEALAGDAAHVELDPPEATPAFVKKHGLFHTSKKVLDGYEDEALAAYFSQSLAGLAKRFYQRENCLLTDVFWAFPNTQGRVFPKITQSVDRLLGGAILGKAHIVPDASGRRPGDGRLDRR